MMSLSYDRNYYWGHYISLSVIRSTYIRVVMVDTYFCFSINFDGFVFNRTRKKNWKENAFLFFSFFCCFFFSIFLVVVPNGETIFGMEYIIQESKTNVYDVVVRFVFDLWLPALSLIKSPAKDRLCTQTHTCMYVFMHIEI